MNWILYVLMAVHLFACPYTKVEESFNLQAMHDLLFYGSNITQYDHLEFPGVVPRTFLGPIAVATLSYPFLLLNISFGMQKFFMQYIVRIVLGSLVMTAFIMFKRGVNKQFGFMVASWLQLITASQFHFMFYSSRPLPNTFALILALLCFYYWMIRNERMFIFTSAAAVIIFRAELSILLGFIALEELISRRLNFLSILCWGLPAGLCMLGLTVAIDSFFWRRTVWPEGEVLWFNIFLNKSSEWGVSPWAWYFYSALPRAMLASILFIPFALILDYRIRALVYPALGFVIVYSFLPHKELRFIIYTIPLLNVAVARVCAYLWNNRFKTVTHTALLHLSCLHLIINICITFLITIISYHNYPGGYAMARLHELELSDKDLHLHIDVYCAQTGVSRFTELNSRWRYNKTENLAPGGYEMMKFTHILMEWPEDEDGWPLRLYVNTHTTMDIIHGYSYWTIDFSVFPPIQMFLSPRVIILKKTLVYSSLILNNTNMKSLKS